MIGDRRGNTSLEFGNFRVRIMRRSVILVLQFAKLAPEDHALWARRWRLRCRPLRRRPGPAGPERIQGNSEMETG
eukprot:5372339-Heterocapsa_arctica.AAC.1